MKQNQQNYAILNLSTGTDVTLHNPDSKTVLEYLDGKFVIAGTGHRPDKLGGYGFPWLQDVVKDGEIVKKAGVIKALSKSFGSFNNFSINRNRDGNPILFQVRGKAVKSAEHGFQLLKAIEGPRPYSIRQLELIEKIQKAASAKEAKALGQQVEIAADWQTRRVSIMKEVLAAKFQQRQLREKLLATGTCQIEHANNHGDQFWGTVKGEGANMLGKLLMEVREDIRSGMTSEQIRCFTHPVESLFAVAVRQLRELKPDVVISGGALGWDTALALAAIKLGIPLVMAIPFPGQAEAWAEESQVRWEKLLAHAAFVVCTGSQELADTDIQSAMQWRNEWMVDRATKVLACWDGSTGGTGNCVRDAREQNVAIHNCYSAWAELAGFQQAATDNKPVVRRALHPEYGIVETIDDGKWPKGYVSFVGANSQGGIKVTELTFL